VEERDPLPQRHRGRRPPQDRQARRPDPLHQRRRRRRSRRGSSGRGPELHATEAALDPLDEVVAIDVPLQADALVDLVGELHRHLVGVQAGGESDPGSAALAVEVGGDDERLVGERIGVGEPRTGAGAELELPRPTPGREPVGECVEQCGTGPIGVDQVGIEPDADAPGEVAGSVTQTADGAPIGLVVALATRQDAQPQRQVGREVVGPAAQGIALVDQHGERTAERCRFGDEHPRQARMDR
jgi:hypothetical protein